MEDRESGDGDLVEVSRNFFVACRETGEVWSVGDDVDDVDDYGHDALPRWWAVRGRADWTGYNGNQGAGLAILPFADTRGERESRCCL